MADRVHRSKVFMPKSQMQRHASSANAIGRLCRSLLNSGHAVFFHRQDSGPATEK